MKENNKGKEILKLLQENYKINTAQDLSGTLKDMFKGALQEIKNRCTDKYASAFKIWESNWDAIYPFFQFSDSIRKIMYTTNTIESLNRQFRKFTKTKSVFPTDMSLLKCLYLATKNITKKWNQSYRNWGPILSELSIMVDGRI